MKRVQRLASSLVLAAVVCTSTAWTAPAAAQVGRDRAAAQVLFDEAVKLRDGGDVAAACPKFEESLRLDQAPGTRFNLADCYERLGRYATSWTHFLEVLAIVEQAGQEQRAQAVRKRVKALEPRLSRLAVDVQQPLPGLVIKRDGVDVGQPAWGTPVPVDPGNHKVEASAPGYLPWSAERQVQGEGKVTRLTVPPLEKAPEGAGPAAGGDGGGSSPQAPIGWAVGGLGLVGLGVGTAFGLVALLKKNDVDAMCPDLGNCSQEGADLNAEAQLAGNVSTGMFIAGGALVVGGLVLILTAPSDEAPAAAAPATAAAPLPWLALGLSPRLSGAALTLDGRF